MPQHRIGRIWKWEFLWFGCLRNYVFCLYLEVCCGFYWIFIEQWTDNNRSFLMNKSMSSLGVFLSWITPTSYLFVLLKQQSWSIFLRTVNCVRFCSWQLLLNKYYTDFWVRVTKTACEFLRHVMQQFRGN